jgi:hypothetical protein
MPDSFDVPTLPFPGPLQCRMIYDLSAPLCC